MEFSVYLLIQIELCSLNEAQVRRVYKLLLMWRIFLNFKTSANDWICSLTKREHFTWNKTQLISRLCLFAFHVLPEALETLSSRCGIVKEVSQNENTQSCNDSLGLKFFFVQIPTKFHAKTRISLNAHYLLLSLILAFPSSTKNKTFTKEISSIYIVFFPCSPPLYYYLQHCYNIFS